MAKSTITREQITSWMNDANYALEEPLNADDAAAARAILAMGHELLAAMDQKPALHRYRRKAVEPYGPYPWHYEVFVDYPRPVECIEDEYFYAAPPVVTGFAVDGEPVAWLLSGGGAKNVVCFDSGNAYADPLREVTPLYRHAQPAPVVPDDVLKALQKVARIRLDMDGFDGDRRGIADCLCDAEEALIEVVNRRAAMLQAAPVCTCPSGDGSLRWPCPVHPGNSPVVPDGIERVASMAEYLGNFAAAAIIRQLAANQPQNAPQNIPEIIPDCWCRTCRPVVLNDMRFVVCPDCGNKRCPRANDHRNACTGSNEPGQEGSAYPAALQLPGSEPATVPGKWIPVSERMPEDRISVILWDAEIGEVTSGHYSHKTQTFYHCGDAIENEITHWMPPPCAPQEPSLACISKRSQHLS
ncbi:TPA: DUF551 domain-containing protein [Klebsiella pneumoniae subsp. pneumoniae]|nr:DUF551 domain-containing protein [Klebsiella pneumoniae]HDS8144889.1 DUF551 domain-containing protein [Klebsiella pneumoniae subsp. pneumoniae]HDU3889947.1 DUF551 domain-containing protein [Klebsiella pneumoniae subsp. pneumoniae]HDU6062934.1 DUF551 domain-containing protein [Klebsiella pneumoniae subsp. pneumoniae]